MKKNFSYTLKETIDLFLLPPIALISLIRMSSSFYMFIAPLEGALLSMFLDGIDQHFVVYAKLPKKTYQYIDKILDYQHYIFIVIFIVFFQLPITAFLLLLFIYRTFGHIIFHYTQNDKVFIVFPNLFELIFVLYLVFERFQIPLSVYDYRVLLACVAFKTLNEVYIHVFPLDFAYRFQAWLARIQPEKKE